MTPNDMNRFRELIAARDKAELAFETKGAAAHYVEAVEASKALKDWLGSKASAILEGADLRGADLEGADLRGANDELWLAVYSDVDVRQYEGMDIDTLEALGLGSDEIVPVLTEYAKDHPVAVERLMVTVRKWISEDA